MVHLCQFDSQNAIPFELTIASYNAPELYTWDGSSPIDLFKCDIWAFGLLVWEIFLRGKYYFDSLLPSSACARSDQNFGPIDPIILLTTAKSSVPVGINRPYLQHLFTVTIRKDPIIRISDLRKLPIISKWQ